MPRSNAATEVVVTFADPILAPLTRGDEIGRVQVFQDGELLVEQPLQALEDSEAAGFFKRLWDSFKLWFSQLFV